ncbi:MAG: DUF1501 domain-containing protein [Planctomycetales bacterium]
MSRQIQSLRATITRRAALQAGSIGLIGLPQLYAWGGDGRSSPVVPDRSVIFLFLTGGLSHQDTFDMKPLAPDTVRSEFRPIETRTPGLQICEHLPLLAEQSDRYALVRSVSTNSSGHEEACHMLLSGRLDSSPGFNVKNVPSPLEWPSMAAQVMHATRGRNNLPSAAVLPQPSINEAGEVRPGQNAGRLGPQHDAWRLNIAAPCPLGNGACPHCFRFNNAPFHHASPTIFETPRLTLPEGGSWRFQGRLGLLSHLEEQQRSLEAAASVNNLDRHRQQAISLLANPKVRNAFNVEQADERTLARYGKNKFGLSMLMSYRLVEAGVNLVQVNVGKNSSWDTHFGNFVNLRDNLLPYLDRAVSALLEDLFVSGLSQKTLLIMAGEFGRTPKINQNAGRDHWGPTNTVLFAGAGIRGGNILGVTDKLAAYPVGERWTPENLAATIYDTLGIPRHAAWHDTDGRTYELYRASPIGGMS